MGQLGVDRGQSSEIKQLGERIVKDHTTANEELTSLASKKGVDLAADAGKHQDMVVDKFSKKSGADFDKEYAKHMIRDHKKDIAKFEKASRECQDTDLKAFIDKTLPTLREHLNLAQAAGRSVGLDEKTLSASESELEAEASGTAAASETGAYRTDKNDGKTLGTETRKGDHKVLGLNTDKHDGKLLGILPAPGKHQKQANGDVSLNADRSSIDNRVDISAGAPPSASVETRAGSDTSPSKDKVDKDYSASRLSFNDVPAAVQNTIKTEGGSTDMKNIKRETENGKVLYQAKFRTQGKNVVLHIAEDGTIVKDNRNKAK